MHAQLKLLESGKTYYRPLDFSNIYDYFMTTYHFLVITLGEKSGHALRKAGDKTVCKFCSVHITLKTQGMSFNNSKEKCIYPVWLA